MASQNRTPEEIQRNRDEQEANNMVFSAEIRHAAWSRR